MSRASARGAARLAHRWVGLAIAPFVIVASVTGCVLAFYDEIDAAFAPSLRLAPPPASGDGPLDPLVLRERLEAQLPRGASVRNVPLQHVPGHATVFYVDAPEGAPLDDEWFVDPFTGEARGSRRWGDLGQGLVNLVPFAYRLHYSLGLGSLGATLLGIAALLWTLDCFVAAYLTWPPRPRRPSRRSWLGRWWTSWLVRAPTARTLVFTWHRASGLWLWGMLLVFAWSAVGLNLRPVQRPILRALFDTPPRVRDRLPPLDEPREVPALPWPEARATAEAALAEVARRRGFVVHEAHRLSYAPDTGLYRLVARTSRDVSERHPGTNLWIDGDDGTLVAVELPTGENPGATLTTWVDRLHFAAVGGLPYRLFVAILGASIALLSATGVWVWARRLRRPATASGARVTRPAVAARRARVARRRRGSGRGRRGCGGAPGRG